MSPYLSMKFQVNLKPWRALEMFVHGGNESEEQKIHSCEQHPHIEMGQDGKEKEPQVSPLFWTQPHGRDDDVFLPFLPTQREDTGPLLVPLLFVKLNELSGDVDVLILPATRAQEPLHEEAGAEKDEEKPGQGEKLLARGRQ